LIVSIALDLLASDEHGSPTGLLMNQFSVVPNPALVKPTQFFSKFALLMGQSIVVPNPALVEPTQFQISCTW
jgi:hypothetical protein